MIALSKQGVTDASEITIGKMTLKWKSMADELDSNKEARVAQYVVCSQVATAMTTCIHLATDKAPVTGQHLQNTIITIPSGVGFLCCPQATQDANFEFPFKSFSFSQKPISQRRGFHIWAGRSGGSGNNPLLRWEILPLPPELV